MTHPELYEDIGIKRELLICLIGAAFSYTLYALLSFVNVSPFLEIQLTYLGTGFTNYILLWLIQTVIIVHPAFKAILLLRARARPPQAGLVDAQAQFERVLRDKKQFARFKESVAKSFCLENVLFLEEAQALFESLGVEHGLFKDASGLDLGRMKREGPSPLPALDALRTKYFLDDSSLQLNISSELQNSILRGIARTRGNPEQVWTLIATEVLPALATIKYQVVLMLFQNSFPRFAARNFEEP